MTPMKNNYFFRHQCPVKQIIYPTPPYMSIRREGIELFRLPVKRRKLMDMIKRFDPNDISYIDDDSFFTRFENENATYIQDYLKKYFVIHGNNVSAESLRVGNTSKAAKMQIAFHTTTEQRDVITLKVQNQDLYFSYTTNAGKQLKALPLGQKNLKFENPETKEFFFYLIPDTSSRHKFESVKQPGSFISTSSDGNALVTVEPSSDNTHRREFTFDPSYNIRDKNTSKLDKGDTGREDNWFYWYNDRIFQDRYQSSLAREDYVMDVTSQALDRSYRCPRQDNLYQRCYL